MQTTKPRTTWKRLKTRRDKQNTNLTKFEKSGNKRTLNKTEMADPLEENNTIVQEEVIVEEKEEEECPTERVL